MAVKWDCSAVNGKELFLDGMGKLNKQRRVKRERIGECVQKMHNFWMTIRVHAYGRACVLLNMCCAARLYGAVIGNRETVLN